MILDELRCNPFDVSTCLTDDFKITNHCILEHGIVQKASFIHILAVAENTGDCLIDVAQVVRQPKRIADQRVRASAITLRRNFSGKAAGVNTST